MKEESKCKPNVIHLKPLKNNNMTGLSYYIPKDNGYIVKHLQNNAGSTHFDSSKDRNKAKSNPITS